MTLLAGVHSICIIDCK